MTAPTSIVSSAQVSPLGAGDTGRNALGTQQMP
jgi:hypothetical protein